MNLAFGTGLAVFWAVGTIAVITGAAGPLRLFLFLPIAFVQFIIEVAVRSA